MYRFFIYNFYSIFFIYKINKKYRNKIVWKNTVQKTPVMYTFAFFVVFFISFDIVCFFRSFFDIVCFFRSFFDIVCFFRSFFDII